MTYNILATGSAGNATILDGSILIDCGVPFKVLEPFVQDLKLVLLTHEHGDHFKPSTISALAKARPALRYGCCDYLVGKLISCGVRQSLIDVYRPFYHSVYDNFARICPVPLPHDAPNCGYRIELKNGERAFYATDCGSLDGIGAQNYDLYLVEANHRTAELEGRAAEKEASGAFAYERRAAENHLSYEQAVDWLTENMGPESIWVPMHGHKEKNNEEVLKNAGWTV